MYYLAAHGVQRNKMVWLDWTIGGNLMTSNFYLTLVSIDAFFRTY